MPLEHLKPIQFSDLKSWPDDDHQAALAAFKRSAREMLHQGHAFTRSTAFGGLRAEWVAVCEAALSAPSGRSFFEDHFTPLRVADFAAASGLFTGYYEPLAEGSPVRSATFDVPIYAKPDDLVAFNDEEGIASGVTYGRYLNGRPVPYHDRIEIEAGAIAGRGLEICFLRSWVDAFFIHIQGNGRVKFEDGSTMRLSYAAKNGQPYTGIGAVLLARGEGTPEMMSMQLLRQWLADNADRARELLNQNRSYVFFQETKITEPHLGALGAAKVPLTPRRSMAVDRRYWTFGTPLWLETTLPQEAENDHREFCQLMIAQDTGSAIRGMIRGDVYWGWGEDAALVAGHMKSKGSLVAFLPKPLAARLIR